jgi:hypothetical protein
LSEKRHLEARKVGQSEEDLGKAKRRMPRANERELTAARDRLEDHFQSPFAFDSNFTGPKRIEGGTVPEETNGTLAKHVSLHTTRDRRLLLYGLKNE